MSYYTQHTLTVRKIKDREEFNKLVEDLKDKDIIGYALEEGTYADNLHEAMFPPYEEAKWYRHSEDMVYISEKYPHMYFQLEGIGESIGDFWQEYYHDMDIETCRGEIVYEQPKKVQWTELIKF